MRRSTLMWGLLVSALAAPLVACGGSEEEPATEVDAGDEADGEDVGTDAGGEPDVGEDSDTGDDPDIGDDPDADDPDADDPVSNAFVEIPLEENTWNTGITPGSSSSWSSSWNVSEAFGSASWYRYVLTEDDFDLPLPLPEPVISAAVGAVEQQPQTFSLMTINSGFTDAQAGEVMEFRIVVMSPLGSTPPSELGVGIDSLYLQNGVTKRTNLALDWLESPLNEGEIRELRVSVTVPEGYAGEPLNPSLYVANYEAGPTKLYMDNARFGRYEQLEEVPTGFLNGDFEEPVLHRERLYSIGAIGWRAMTNDFVGIRRPAASELPWPMESGQNVMEVGFLAMSSASSWIRVRSVPLAEAQAGDSFLIRMKVANRTDRNVPANLAMWLMLADPAATNFYSFDWRSEQATEFDLEGENANRWQTIEHCATVPAGQSGVVSIEIQGEDRRLGGAAPAQRMMISEMSFEKVDACL